MNIYSRALRHISMNDVKQKHQQKIAEQKILEQKKVEDEKYIASVMEKKKYDWRKEIIDEGMVTTNFYSTGRKDEVDLSTSVDVPTEFTGDILSGHNFTELRSTIVPVDYSNHDSIVIDISGGGGAAYWSDSTAGTFTPGVYAFFYTLDDDGNIMALNGDLQGGSPREFPPFGTLPTIDTLLNYGTNTLTIPSNLKQGNLELFVYQNANTEPNIIGGVTPSTTFNSITLRGKVPVNVFVSLDNPEATSFVRTGSGNLSPEEKEKKLRDMLKASDNYLRKMYGSDFPGTGAEFPGESRFTSQQLSNIDKQIQDLQAQAEKNKQDAAINKWKAAAELALGVAGVAGGIGAVAKIPTAIRAAKTVSQVRQATKAYDTYKALDAIRKAADIKRITTPGKYTGIPRSGGTMHKGGGMYKS